MSSPGPASNVSVMDVLRECGWWPDDDRAFSEEPALKFNFGNFELSAGVALNEYFRRVVSFHGPYQDRRNMGVSSFEVPEHVESRAQALAWIAYGLRNVVPLAIRPEWIDEGKAAHDTLPWVRQKQAYARRPRATIDREWMPLPAPPEE